MRPMRLHKREITDPEILREIIEECDVVRIGASDSDGIFVVPVNYGYDLSFQNGKADLKLYIHGAGEGRKAEAFASNPLVAVEMDRMVSVISGDYTCSYSCAYQSIMGNGSIRRLDGKQREDIRVDQDHGTYGARGRDPVQSGNACQDRSVPD